MASIAEEPILPIPRPAPTVARPAPRAAPNFVRPTASNNIVVKFYLLVIYIKILAS
jgi:hypothetical protein